MEEGNRVSILNDHILLLSSVATRGDQGQLPFLVWPVVAHTKLCLLACALYQADKMLDAHVLTTHPAVGPHRHCHKGILISFQVLSPDSPTQSPAVEQLIDQ